MLLVEDGAFLNIDRVARFMALGQFGEIANFALQANVGDETQIGLRVETRQVARVGIAVRVAVGHLEEQYEIVAIGYGGHPGHSCELVTVVSSFSASLLR